MEIQAKDQLAVPVKRPVLVWIVSVFYFVSVGWTILSFLLIFSGTIPLDEAQDVYFKSQTFIDYGLAFIIGMMNIVGALFLFLLKKPAFYLFVTALGLSLTLTGYQIFKQNWLGTISGSCLVGEIVSWGINIAVIFYSRRLIHRGVLRGSQRDRTKLTC